MNSSMWLLTAICLACGEPESEAGAAAAQPGPAPMVVQSSNSCCEDQRPCVGHWFAGTHDCARIGDCHDCGCERPGLFARLLSRLRALFCRSCHDSCCEVCEAKCETSRPATCADCGDCGQRGRGFCQRLASLFHRRCSEAPCCEPAPTMMVQTSPALVLPPVQSTLPIQPASTEPARPALEIAKEYLDKVANADDYSWVTGQLFYIHIHADQGLWVVRYAPVDKEDRYGGSVVLAPATSMTDFREGDLVNVHGEILNQGRASRYLGGPLYRGLTVALKDRARP